MEEGLTKRGRTEKGFIKGEWKGDFAKKLRLEKRRMKETKRMQWRF